MRLRDGERGEDLILKVPVGTVITNTDTGETKELTKEGEQLLDSHGGFPGRGSFQFPAGIENDRGCRFGRPAEFGQVVASECTYRRALESRRICVHHAGAASRRVLRPHPG